MIYESKVLDICDNGIMASGPDSPTKPSVALVTIPPDANGVNRRMANESNTSCESV